MERCKGCNVENTSSLNGFGHGIEQWVQQMERLAPLTGQGRYQQIEQLLGQRDLDALLAIFAERVANIVRIHSLQFDCGQPHPLISHPPQARLTLHAYRFELRGRHEQLFGQLHYELEHPLSDGQRRLLEQYHQLFSLPLPLYLRLDRLEQQVRLDHLTGLGNRAYFDEAIGRAVEQHSREPHGLVLVLLDLDRFKQVNDTWGHPVGDLVLSRFAQLLQGCIRGTDQAFRLGGDEFALLLQPADPEAWRPVWLRLQHVLHSHKELSAFSVGCSLGAASWQSGMDVQRLYETADTHLYARKKAGGSSLPE
ncbi:MULTISPECIES: GGDEF domain-containing protein [Aeromonas]|uniref:diguanylate cyclase n=4 Tax=Aeromonas caviae TaxID=648 RepID=A0AAE9PLK5_AERCA|nr:MULTISPECIES: GGDEF domain-containing protein [Aeromonas]UDN26037.1 GGDEF domain-containing protein [Aeromonas caviae]UZC86791.2 GGDEF domain-containing protein [Aeromonas caviae]BBG90471.1 GGDEF domain-containing protein [Aeromonas caviae]BBT54123.1 GGDEF domain-containing protein [Aeromonas caviae]